MSVNDGKITTRQAVVGLVVMVVLAAVAVAIVVLNTGSSDEEARVPARASSSPAPQQSSSPTTSTPATPPAAAAPLPTTLPTAAPENVSWSFFQGYALPSSKTVGPLRVDGPVHAGYARSPEGALLAAVQINIRAAFTPDDGWRQVVEMQTLPSSGRDVYVGMRETVTDFTVAPGAPQFAGFRFVTYSADVAVLQIAARTSAGQLQVGTNTVRWVDGDWKLEFLPEGAMSTTVQPLPDLSGFVIWGGS